MRAGINRWIEISDRGVDTFTHIHVTPFLTVLHGCRHRLVDSVLAPNQVEAEDFSQQLYRNVNMASANPLYERRGKETYVSVLQGQLRYNSASREAASAKYTYVVSELVARSLCYL